MSIPSSKPLSMAIQKACIQERFPQFKFHRQRSVWRGKFRPTSTSPEYLVEIDYALYKIPRVFVLKPKLHPNAPHIYKESGSLCLYYPPDNSWNYQKLLGNTIFLWTAEWLYYYELWFATGQWLGPEAPHDANKSENS